MRVITAMSLAKEVPERWKASYYRNGKWEGSIDAKKIYKALEACKILTPARVKNIIGNDSWTSITCDSCYAENINRAVRLSEADYEFALEPNNDGSWRPFDICVDCAFKAWNKFGPSLAKTR
jgi:hypothetical protein